MTRRGAIAGALAIALAGPTALAAAPDGTYGLVGRITAKLGQRDALARLLMAGTVEMPGCLAYLVAEDVSDPAVLWVTEAWETKTRHEASLTLPGVRETIRRAMPMVAEFDTVATTRPITRAGA